MDSIIDREKQIYFDLILKTIQTQEKSVIIRRKIYELFFQNASESAKSNQQQKKKREELYEALENRDEEKEFIILLKFYSMDSYFYKAINDILRLQCQPDKIFWLLPIIQSLILYRGTGINQNQYLNLKQLLQNSNGKAVYIKNLGFWSSSRYRNIAINFHYGALIKIQLDLQQLDNSNSGFYYLQKISQNKGEQQILFNPFNIWQVISIQIINQKLQFHEKVVKYLMKLRYVNSGDRQNQASQSHLQVMERQKEQFGMSSFVQGIIYRVAQSKTDAARQYFKKLKKLLKKYLKNNKNSNKLDKNCLQLIKKYLRQTKISIKKQDDIYQNQQYEQQSQIEQNQYNVDKNQRRIFFDNFVEKIKPSLKKLQLTWVKSQFQDIEQIYKKTIQQRNQQLSDDEKQWQHNIRSLLQIFSFIFGGKS